MPRISKQQELINAQAKTITEQDAIIEELRAEIARLTPPKKVAAPVRYWDEFSERKDGLNWARESKGRVMQRPVQRLEA